MNAIKNKVQLIGRLGQVPDIRTAESGKKVANLRIATNESYRDANGEKLTETQWHQIVAWGKLADIAERYLEKGMEIAITGRLVHRAFTDKKGSRHSVAEVHAGELLILSKKTAEVRD